jgi:hypothetical protein
MKNLLDSIRRLIDRLRGRSMGATVCPQCGAPVAYGSNVCPNGHRVR